MIDIHTHIIPGVDDGSKSYEESLEIIRMLKMQGVNEVICTSHQDEKRKYKDVLIERFNELKRMCDIPLYLGCEIYYYEGMIDDLNKGVLLTINDTKYVLVEFSTHIETPIPDIVYELSVAGYKPIVAHIERYPYLSKSDIKEIRKNGALIQVNGRAFNNPEYKKVLKFLLKNDYVDFVASDSHNTDTRSPDFYNAKKYIEKKFPKAYNKLFVDTFKFE